jgi:drug/metabolite transporter (DMT)-like permease
MSRCTLRYIFTVLIYAGVAIFLWPYLTGHISTGLIFLVAGIGLAVLSGILRAYCTEGDCTEPVPAPPQTHHTTTPR